MKICHFELATPLVAVEDRIVDAAGNLVARAVSPEAARLLVEAINSAVVVRYVIASAPAVQP